MIETHVSFKTDYGDVDKAQSDKKLYQKNWCIG